jgi:hypothetical protein
LIAASFGHRYGQSSQCERKTPTRCALPDSFLTAGRRLDGSGRAGNSTPPAGLRTPGDMTAGVARIAAERAPRVEAMSGDSKW